MMTYVHMQVRGTIEEAEELQDDDVKGGDDDDDGDGQRVKPASRERQKEILGRLPANDKQRARQVDYSPYEHRQRYNDAYDDY